MEDVTMKVPVRLAVVYYSATGNVHAMAQRAALAAENVGAEVRLRKVAELAPVSAVEANPAWATHARSAASVAVACPQDVEWADAVLLGTPTRFGNVSAQLKQFIDQLGPLWSRGALADKFYAAFTSTSTPHGGHESTLLALYNCVYHFGGIIVAPGYTDPVKFAEGNPYGVSHTSGDHPIDERTLDAMDHLASRLLAAAQARRGLVSEPSGT